MIRLKFARPSLCPATFAGASMIMRFLLLLGVVAALNASTYAQGTPAEEFDSQDLNVTQVANAGTVWLGFEFSITSTIYVQSLGADFWVRTGNSNIFSTPASFGNIPVGIFDAGTGTSLISGVVSSSDTLYGSFYYNDLSSPVALNPGTYIVAALDPGLDFARLPQSLSTGPGINYVNGVYNFGSGFILDSVPDVGGTFGISSIPEPSTYAAVLGMASLGLVLMRWHRRLVAA